MLKSVFTWTMLAFWLMCSTGSECAPVLSKPINATRKISQPSTAAPVATTRPAFHQSTTTRPSKPINPTNQPSSSSNTLSTRPESMINPITADVEDDPLLKRNSSLPANNKRDGVNAVVSSLNCQIVKTESIILFCL